MKHGGFKYSWKTLSSSLKNSVKMTSGEKYRGEIDTITTTLLEDPVLSRLRS